MVDLCLSLSAGEDTFKLHSVQLELEAVERQVHELLGEKADSHKSKVSMQHAANTPTTSTPCVSLHRPRAPWTRCSQMSFTPAPGNHGPCVQQRKKRSRLRTTTSPSFKSSRSPPATVSLLNARRDAVIVGDSIVRHVRAMLAEGKLHNHYFIRTEQEQ